VNVSVIESVRTRFESSQGWDVLARVRIERGSASDYEQLAEHHYRAARPGSFMRVFVAVVDEQTAATRYCGRGARRSVIGVLVESMPALQCRLRDEALGKRYGGVRSTHQRALLLGREMRCISRVIVDPRWRGLGVAVRLVRHALDHATTVYTESLAAMGRVHPFFERAGMTAYRRPAHETDLRLIGVLERAGLDPVELARPRELLEQVHGLSDLTGRWVLDELRLWYRRFSGRAAGASADPLAYVEAARERLLCEPVYYLHDNREG